MYGKYEAMVKHLSGNTETFWVIGSTVEEARQAALAELLGAIGFTLTIRNRSTGETKTFKE